ncbi:MAG: hypothetical protein GKR89_15810 [Candidatus Latescibacteria bacterium]|nr:hypothetical protein [Candidatus Latescibacterota bacterium]
MNISDSVLKAHLDRVWWLGGATCGGKSTLTDILAAKHGLTAYHPEDCFQEHKKLACQDDHPTMLQPFHGWEWFFGRPIDRYGTDLMESDCEQFDMILVDLLKFSAQGRVIVDCHALAPAVAQRLVRPERVIFLFADPTTIRRLCLDREDKRDILGVINGLAEPDKVREHVLDVCSEVSARKLAQVKELGFNYILRDGDTPREDSLRRVEEHFGWG